MPDIQELISRVEQRPSPLDGNGVFAKVPIVKGVYIVRGGQNIETAIRQFGWPNSPLLPPWRQLLLPVVVVEGDDIVEESSMNSRLSRFRHGFVEYEKLERSMANFDVQLNRENDELKKFV